MAVLAVAGVKGSPGATTLALVLAGLLPAPALYADVDLAGGDLWLRLPGPDGRPLDPDRGLLTLAAAAHREAAELGQHVQLIAGGLPVLLGLTTPEQAAGLASAWPHVHSVLAAAPGTVVADCGRFTGPASAPPVFRSADAVVLVARTDLVHLSHLRERLRAAAELRAWSDAGPLGVVLVAPARERTAAAEAQKLLDAAGLPARVLGVVAHDPKGAALLTGARYGAPGRTDLVRSVRGLVPAVVDLLARAVAARATAGVG